MEVRLPLGNRPARMSLFEQMNLLPLLPSCHPVVGVSKHEYVVEKQQLRVQHVGQLDLLKLLQLELRIEAIEIVTLREF
jgi:hypothetical protein